MKPIHTATIVAILSASCSMSSFDEKKSQAWSDSHSASDIGATNYGVALTGVTTNALGATIAVAGMNPLGIGAAFYDEFGNRRLVGSNVSGTELERLTLTSPPNLVAAPEPVNGAVGLVAMGGLAAANEIVFFDVADGSITQLESISGELCQVGGNNFGHRMVFAYTDAGAPEKIDLLALGEGNILLVTDVDPESPETGEVACCQLGTTAMDLAVADFLEEENNVPLAEEILVSFDGQFTMMRASDIITASNLVDSCDAVTPLFTPIGRDGQSDFGSRIAIGDIDDDEQFDIAITSPDANEIVLFPNFDQSNPVAPTKVLEVPVNAGSFASGPIVFADIDNQDGDELLVGDPLASPEGISGAGQVSIYTYSDDDGGKLELRASVHDSEAYEGQAYGRSLAEVEFVFGEDDSDIFAVGAENEVFTLFRSVSNGVDPRL